MKIEVKTVEEYLDKVPSDHREALETFRAVVFEDIPEVLESMDYGMPTYASGGKICAFASQKNHMSLYIFKTGVLDRHKGSFSHLSVGKSCIRFKRLDEMPLETFRTILKEPINAQ